MRTVNTLILRVRADLPITAKEAEFLHNYLDAQELRLERRLKFLAYCVAVTGVLMLCWWVFRAS